jgi:hypothetical protein
MQPIIFLIFIYHSTFAGPTSENAVPDDNTNICPDVYCNFICFVVGKS